MQKIAESLGAGGFAPQSPNSPQQLGALPPYPPHSPPIADFWLWTWVAVSRAWYGIEDFMNGMENNLPYQFCTEFRAWYLQKNLCMVFTEKFIRMSETDKQYSYRSIQHLFHAYIIFWQIVVLWLCVLHKQ